MYNCGDVTKGQLMTNCERTNITNRLMRHHETKMGQPYLYNGIITYSIIATLCKKNKTLLSCDSHIITIYSLHDFKDESKVDITFF